MRFTKMHGLGNDYIVVEWVEFAREIGRKNSEILECKFPEKHPEAEQALRTWIQHVCDRHFGIGADGVLIICPSQTADFRMLIYNADGSRAQMCGNGIRCCAKYMWDSGKLNAYRYDNYPSEKRLGAPEANGKNLYDNCNNREDIYESGEKYVKKNQYNELSGGIFRKRKYICTQSGYKVGNNTKINNENNGNINKSGDCNNPKYKFLYQSGDDVCKIEKNNNKYGEKYFQYLKIDTDSGIKTVKILENINSLTRNFRWNNINKKIEKAVNETKKVSQDTVKNIIKNRVKRFTSNIVKPVSTEILVNMGKPSTDYEHINIDYEGCSYTIIPVSMGNLHAVVFLDEEEALWDNQKIIEGNKRKKSIEAENLENRSVEIDLKKRIEYENLKDMQKNVECDENKSNTDKYTRLAAYIQHLDYFADGVNVEFAQILDSSHIQMRVWERGVGETLACGTGACAVCVAAVKITMEKTEKSGSDINTDVAEKHRQYIHIKLRGGTLRILWTPGEDVWMAGPAVTVFEGKYWC